MPMTKRVRLDPTDAYLEQFSTVGLLSRPEPLHRVRRDLTQERCVARDGSRRGRPREFFRGELVGEFPLMSLRLPPACLDSFAWSGRRLRVPRWQLMVAMWDVFLEDGQEVRGYEWDFGMRVDQRPTSTHLPTLFRDSWRRECAEHGVFQWVMFVQIWSHFLDRFGQPLPPPPPPKVRGWTQPIYE